MNNYYRFPQIIDDYIIASSLISHTFELGKRKEYFEWASTMVTKFRSPLEDSKGADPHRLLTRN
jgi:hypothetical protein